MLTFSMLNEEVVPREYIGAGLGGLGGAVVGGALGQAIGRAIDPEVGQYYGSGLGTAAGLLGGRFAGEKLISDPKAPADFNKPSHRVGYLANPYSAPIIAGWNAHPGLGGVATIGAGIYNGLSEKGAKRLGYKMPGRIAAAIPGIGPLVGLAAPDETAKNK